MISDIKRPLHPVEEKILKAIEERQIEYEAKGTELLNFNDVAKVTGLPRYVARKTLYELYFARIIDFNCVDGLLTIR